jgi:hypothetical protein
MDLPVSLNTLQAMPPQDYPVLNGRLFTSTEPRLAGVCCYPGEAPVIHPLLLPYRSCCTRITQKATWLCDMTYSCVLPSRIIEMNIELEGLRLHLFPSTSCAFKQEASCLHQTKWRGMRWYIIFCPTQSILPFLMLPHSVDTSLPHASPLSRYFPSSYSAAISKILNRAV